MLEADTPRNGCFDERVSTEFKKKARRETGAFDEPDRNISRTVSIRPRAFVAPGIMTQILEGHRELIFGIDLVSGRLKLTPRPFPRLKWYKRGIG